MARIIQFPVNPPEKLGHRRVRKRRKPNLEDYGQMNIFDSVPDTTPMRSMPKSSSFFEEALALDEANSKEAERFYLLAIQNNESTEDALCNLGIMMSNQSELSKAIDYLTRCLKHNPRHFEAHYNLGNVYSDLGNLELAKVHYEVSTEIEPTYPNGYYNLGLVLISLKKYKEAILKINKYIELAPNSEQQTASELIKTLNSIAQ